MASFHFASGQPASETMINDIQTLDKFDAEQFTELVDIVFKFLKDPSKSSRLFSELHDFATANNVSSERLKNCIKSLLTIPNAALKVNISLDHLKEDLINLGFSDEKATYFTEQYQTNLLTLSKNILGQTIMVNQLVDMEWKFGVIAASSEIQKVGNTFIQLKLAINKGNKMENVHMELSLPQFYSFLHEMERAKANLELFS